MLEPTTRHFRPYLRPPEIESLSARQRGKLSVAREERLRQQACAFIDQVGVRCGFPRRTIATAQTLYLRFHLFFPYAEFQFVDVALTTLYVSSKLNDTLKKPRDIILASYGIRFPQLVRKRSTAVDISNVDSNVLEHERKRVLGIERLALETICFNFGVHVPFELVIKLGRKLELPKDMIQQAWRVAVDAHRTPAPLSYPPQIIALGALYASALLASQSTTPHDAPDPLVAKLGSAGTWEKEFSVTADAVDDVAHALLDLYITIVSIPPNDPNLHLFSPSPVSPRENPKSGRPSPAPGATPSLTTFKLPAYWTSQTLTELKIHLRDRNPGVMWPAEEETEIPDGMGRNDGTVRYMWD